MVGKRPEMALRDRPRLFAGKVSRLLSSLINQECVIRTAIDPAWRRVNGVVFI